MTADRPAAPRSLHLDPAFVPAGMRADTRVAGWLADLDRADEALLSARVEVRKRVEKAVHLTCEQTGPRTFKVDGGAEPHHVNLDYAWGERCDCGDHIQRHAYCKHLMRADLHLGATVHDRCPDSATGGHRLSGIYSRGLAAELLNAARREEFAAAERRGGR